MYVPFAWRLTHSKIGMTRTVTGPPRGLGAGNGIVAGGGGIVDVVEVVAVVVLGRTVDVVDATETGVVETGTVVAGCVDVEPPPVAIVVGTTVLPGVVTTGIVVVATGVVVPTEVDDVVPG